MRGEGSEGTTPGGVAGRAVTTWALASGALLVLVAGGASLPFPPTEPGEWVSWVEGHGAATVLFSLLRLAALAGAAYVALVSLATATARWARLRRLSHLVDLLTAPALRRVLNGVAGVGLVLPMSAAASAAPDDTATIRRIDGGPVATAPASMTTTTSTTLAPMPEPAAPRGAPVVQGEVRDVTDRPHGALPHTT